MLEGVSRNLSTYLFFLEYIAILAISSMGGKGYQLLVRRVAKIISELVPRLYRVAVAQQVKQRLARRILTALSDSEKGRVLDHGIPFLTGELCERLWLQMVNSGDVEPALIQEEFAIARAQFYMCEELDTPEELETPLPTTPPTKKPPGTPPTTPRKKNAR